MGNITLNKPATASGFVAPFNPSRAVDGIVNDPKNRWVCSQSPAWLTIDLQNSFWINQWSMSMMGSIGWQPNYNMRDFKLQGSTDNINWFDLDSLVNNSANTINRTFNPRLVRFIKVSISKGLAVNNQVSAIADIQAFEPATAPFLSNLVPSIGSFITPFASRSINYSMNVASTVASISFTPTALQSNMVIKVNNSVVVSGQQSQSISLLPGNNTIIVEVISADNSMKTTYTIFVNKAAAASYLSALAVMDIDGNDVELNPNFLQTTFSYTISLDNGIASVKICPSAAEASAVVKVNGNVVSSGTWSALIPVNNGTSLQILVNSTTYTIVVQKS